MPHPSSRPYLIDTRCYHWTTDVSSIQFLFEMPWVYGSMRIVRFGTVEYDCRIPSITQRLLTNEITVLVLYYIIMILVTAGSSNA